MDHHIHHFDDINVEIYLTEEEHNMFYHDDNERTISVTDSEHYLRRYHNSIDDVQRKLNLRSRDVVINKGRLNQNHPSAGKKIKKKKRKHKKIPLYIKILRTKNKSQKKTSS